jgi:PIN domain nuclease of toxin-antitoxin system
MLSRKGRVDLGMPFGEWLERALPRSLEVVPISARVVSAENGLPNTFHGDPADRLIASTALAHDLTLLTPDQKIAFHRICTTIRYRWPSSKGRR